MVLSSLGWGRLLSIWELKQECPATSSVTSTEGHASPVSMSCHFYLFPLTFSFVLSNLLTSYVDLLVFIFLFFRVQGAYCKISGVTVLTRLENIQHYFFDYFWSFCPAILWKFSHMCICPQLTMHFMLWYRCFIMKLFLIKLSIFDLPNQFF